MYSNLMGYSYFYARSQGFPCYPRATQPVRDSLGKETWGEELYREIARIGQLDM